MVGRFEVMAGDTTQDPHTKPGRPPQDPHRSPRRLSTALQQDLLLSPISTTRHRPQYRRSPADCNWPRRGAWSRDSSGPVDWRSTAAARLPRIAHRHPPDSACPWPFREDRPIPSATRATRGIVGNGASPTVRPDRNNRLSFKPGAAERVVPQQVGCQGFRDQTRSSPEQSHMGRPSSADRKRTSSELAPACSGRVTLDVSYWVDVDSCSTGWPFTVRASSPSNSACTETCSGNSIRSTPVQVARNGSA